MKFLANENVPLAAVDSLRQAGFDIISMSRVSPGLDDRHVLDRARDDGRVLITFDKDFAELVFRESQGDVTGVILLRIRPRSPVYLADTLKGLLQGDRTWEGFFSVVGETRIRMVPLPGR